MNTLFRITVFLCLFCYKILSLFIYGSFRLFGHNPHQALQKAANLWSSIATFLFRMQLTTINKELLEQVDPNKPIFLVSNHQSWGDIPAIIHASKNYWGFIAKKELGRIPMLNFWMKKAGCILIDRTKFRQSLQKISQRVSDGNFIPRIALFPEGTRSKTGNVARFKPGGLKVAWHMDAQIITVAIKGTRPTWETCKNLDHKPVVVEFVKLHNLLDIKKKHTFNDWVEQMHKEISVAVQNQLSL